MYCISDKLPKPNHIFLEKITSVGAEIKWEKIGADAKIYGVLLGYKVVLYGRNRELNVTVSNDSNALVLPALFRKSKYTVSLRGFTEYGDGDILEYNFTTLGMECTIYILSRTITLALFLNCEAILDNSLEILIETK